MNCREAEEQDLLERYLLDQLAERERDEFEKHYFECESCFSQVKASLAMQEELRQRQLVRIPAGGVRMRRAWAWTPVFAVFVLLVAVGIWRYSARKHRSLPQVSSSTPSMNAEGSKPSQLPSPAGPPLDELAHVEAPPYSGSVLRGTEDEAQESFRKAMQNYLKGDYANAIPGLRAAVKASPQKAKFNFYLGACYLLTQQSDPAIDSFRKTVSLDDPAYAELAHYYLAKAYLQKRDLAEAKKELQTTIQLGGSRATEAEEILRRLGN
jgi:tetratricopeptide (TPR) repeat protein